MRDFELELTRNGGLIGGSSRLLLIMDVPGFLRRWVRTGILAPEQVPSFFEFPNSLLLALRRIHNCLLCAPIKKAHGPHSGCALFCLYISRISSGRG